jgi:hypothetical protein
MKYRILFILFYFTSFAFAGLPHKSTSVLATGKWYKIAVQETGIHKITYDDFVQMGFDPAAFTSGMIRVYGNGGGMLPESNASPRVDDLRELSIEVVDGGDGKLDPGDYVLFYGESPDKWTFDNVSTKLFIHAKNLYSEYTYYFINTDLGPGKRVTPKSSTDTSYNSNSFRFDDYAFHEADLKNLIKSGRTWYGEEFNDTTRSYDFRFDFPNADPASPIKVVTYVAARAPSISKFYINANSRMLDSVQVDMTDLLNNQNFAMFKQKSTLIYNPPGQLDLNITYKLPTANSLGWLNFLELNCKRYLRWSPPQMGFRDGSTIGPTKITRFVMSNMDPGVTVWNITHQDNITRITDPLSHDTLCFILPTDSLKEFYAFDGSMYYPVHLVESIPNQNLHALSPSTLVIVTHPMFLDEASRLADFHRAKNGLTVSVATTKEVYNEFASGQQDIGAIRDFVKMLFDRGTPGNQTRYLLLFGDGSYDPKDRVPGNDNMIPTFQSTESLSLIQSYVTDDFYGIMGDNEGSGSNGTIEIGIGRFPVSTTDQAKAIVDKIIHYSAVSDTILSSWRNTMTFVADDENQNLHMQQAEQVSNIVKNKYPVFNVNKIYLDAYPMVTIPAGQRFPDVNIAINKAVSDGSLIINYTGHGGEDGWSGEKVLTVGDIESWSNADKLPVFITATCEFSRFDNPERFSAGEMVICHANAGAIALYSTTRQAMATSNFKLDTSFFNSLIPLNGGPFPTMGDLIRISKNRNSNNNNIRNFVLLGDPSQEIAFPRYHVVTNEINNHGLEEGPDTAMGLTVLNVKGEIQDLLGNRMTDFNGTLYPKLFDKPMTYRTLGNKPEPNGSYPQAFQLQNIVLYKGRTAVTNGEFSFSCVIPKDISLQYGKGKISYYAQNGVTDANGYSDKIVIGGRDPSINPVNPGPGIRLFMDTPEFVSGGRTGSNTELLAFLNDSDGINYIGLGLGHELLAVLDGNSSHPIILNDYYEPDLNLFESGVVRYPLTGLASGRHTITLKAWDFYNNSSESQLSFFVTDQPVLSVQQVFNYPNPFSDRTTFQFTPGQDAGALDIQIDITSLTGQFIRTLQSSVTEYGNIPVTIDWDGTDYNGQQLGSGIYVYRLTARGANGAYTQTSQKLVILR